jgi:hypothetical protein
MREKKNAKMREKEERKQRRYKTKISRTFAFFSRIFAFAKKQTRERKMLRFTVAFL